MENTNDNDLTVHVTKPLATYWKRVGAIIGIILAAGLLLAVENWAGAGHGASRLSMTVIADLLATLLVPIVTAMGLLHGLAWLRPTCRFVVGRDHVRLPVMLSLGLSRTVTVDRIHYVLQEETERGPNLIVVLRNNGQRRFPASAFASREQFDMLLRALQERCNGNTPELSRQLENSRKFSHRGAPASIALATFLALIHILRVMGSDAPIDDPVSLIKHGALTSNAILGGEWQRLVAGIFLHQNAFHLAASLVLLLYFGRQAERYLGTANFAVVFLLSGFAGTLTAALLGGVPVGSDLSGGVFGVLGALVIASALDNGRNPLHWAREPAERLVLLFVMLSAIPLVHLMSGSSASLAVLANSGGALGGVATAFALHACNRELFVTSLCARFAALALAAVTVVGLLGTVVTVLRIQEDEEGYFLNLAQNLVTAEFSNWDLHLALARTWVEADSPSPAQLEAARQLLATALAQDPEPSSYQEVMATVEERLAQL